MAPNLYATFDCCFGYILLQAAAALERNHCLINSKLTVGLIYCEESLLQFFHDFLHFAQTIIAWVPTLAEVLVIAEVKIAVEFSEMLSVCNTTIM